MDKGLKTLVYIIGGALLFDEMYYKSNTTKKYKRRNKYKWKNVKKRFRY